MALLESRSYLLETGASKDKPFILHLWWVVFYQPGFRDLQLKWDHYIILNTETTRVCYSPWYTTLCRNGFKAFPLVLTGQGCFLFHNKDSPEFSSSLGKDEFHYFSDSNHQEWIQLFPSEVLNVDNLNIAMTAFDITASELNIMLWFRCGSNRGCPDDPKDTNSICLENAKRWVKGSKGS
ncbi:hypothetical protein D5086_013494 [Populus alba]|uniref:Uncharacterized protein n=1 Tax=Populus alba TaxID=43335 RepID=A0ACC4C5W0_POPAL